jgi:hypothetical protein
LRVFRLRPIPNFKSKTKKIGFTWKSLPPLLSLNPGSLSSSRSSDCAFLVLIASPRLSRLGISIPILDWPRPYEHQLYDRLEERMGNAAHSHYNSLLRRMDSYAHALEREQSCNSPTH